MPTAKKIEKNIAKKPNLIQTLKLKLNKKDGKARPNRTNLFGKISFVIGLVGIFSFALQLYVPLLIILNIIAAIVGLVFGILSLKSEKIGFSAAGITLCIILLNLTLMVGLYNLIISILQNLVSGV